MAKEKQACPRCKSQMYAVAQDKSNKHYCSACQNVWVPGAELKAETLLKAAQAEISELRIINSRLLKKIEELAPREVQVEIFD